MELFGLLTVVAVLGAVVGYCLGVWDARYCARWDDKNPEDTEDGRILRGKCDGCMTPEGLMHENGCPRWDVV